MAAHSTHPLLRRSPRLSRWLAVAVTFIVLGASILPSQAADRPGSTGAVTAYVGQGWG